MGEGGRGTLGGMLAMLVAVAMFSLMDAGLKVLSAHYAPLQVASLRGLVSLPLVLLWCALRGGFGQLLQVRWSLHLWRGALSVLMLAAFAYALRSLPLADAYAIFFVAPLLITALAVPLLGERVDAPRWVAIGVGLLGVLIVLRPSGAGMLSWAGLAVLLAALGYALSNILVRRLGQADSTQALVFWMVALTGVFAGLLGARDWIAPRPEHWPVLAFIGVVGTLGQVALTEAFRRSAASQIAPLEYTALLWGLALDWGLWHTAPNLRMLGGAAVIVASGLYLLQRERRAAG